MKKIMMSLVAAFAFTTLAAPAFADDKPAAEPKPAKEKKAGKKADKKEEPKKEEAAK